MKYIDRDISWLSFNERILQEAENIRTPLEDRLKFLAIYSSNLEEFYKVRVASHRFAQKFKGDKKNKFGHKPSQVLQSISEIVDLQQERFGKIFRNNLMPAYKSRGIKLISFEELERHLDEIKESIDFDRIRESLEIQEITNEADLSLDNQSVYLYILDQHKQWLAPLDYKKHGRFLEFARTSRAVKLVQLDDVVRYILSQQFAETTDIYAVKVSRDAELYLNDEEDENIVKKIKKSIKKRESGLPSRLLFDQRISFKDINVLRKKTQIDMAGLMPGGMYHNFYDFFGFPKPMSDQTTQSLPQTVPCPRLDQSNNWFEEIKTADVFLSFPYQDYGYVTELLQKACEDQQVTDICITLYRVASDSKICQALEKAALNGKNIFVLDEVQARFDEESNIFWGERLENAGATVRYGVQGLKVHAKTFLIKRKENNEEVYYSYLGTGNFNEKTAKIYADHALITANASIAEDLIEVFDFLRGNRKQIKTKKLLVAPFTLRAQLVEKIEREIALSSNGKKGHLQIKLNSLEDTEMIDLIRKAGDEDVKVDLLVRGICCYTPLTEKQTQNIRIVSVVDNLLEHTRIYHFNNNGNSETYLASADWMTRNLSGRIELAFPIEHKQHQSVLLSEIDFQLHDSVKGRQVMDNNAMVEGKGTTSAQEKMYNLIAQSNKHE